jgi:DNA-binding transcriptional regulator YiaG
MIPEQNDLAPAKKAKPFPWQCPRCLKVEVVPKTIEHTIEVKHDGTLYSITIPELVVPTCRACQERVFTSNVDEQISAALRDGLGLLTPDQIHTGMRTLGLAPGELAARLGVSADAVSRWADGALIQSRAMDNLMRVFFAIPAVRAVLTGHGQDPTVGAHAVVA